MPTHRSRRRLGGLPALALSVAAATALCVSSSTIAIAKTKHHRSPTASSLAGRWSGSYGGAFSGTFTLKWTASGSKLTGTIKLSNPSGSYTCDGSLSGGKITFGVVGAGATYTGSVSGSSMSGSYRSPRGGGSWSAHKTS